MFAPAYNVGLAGIALESCTSDITQIGCVILSRSPSNTGRDDEAVAFFCSITRSKAKLSAL